MLGTVAVALVLTAGAAACSGSGEAGSTAPSSTATSPTAPTTTATSDDDVSLDTEAPPPTGGVKAPEHAPAELRCADVVDTAADPTAAGLEVVLDGVALPTGRALQASPDVDGGLFAKQGLLVRAGWEGDITVPDPDADGLTVAWGHGAPATTRLHIPACPAPDSTTGWLAFVGGYHVPEAGCVALQVVQGGAAEAVRIGVGAPCPGQDPPPPAP